MRPFYFCSFFFLLCSRIAFAAPFEAGLGIKVETTGFFLSPKLAHVAVVDVKPQSPADTAGVKVGDTIIAINDCSIPGCPAKKAKALTQTAPVTLTLINAAGEQRQTVLRPAP